MASDVCSSTAVKFINYLDLPKKGYQAEHLQEVGNRDLPLF